MRKRILATLLSSLALAVFLPAAASANVTATSGSQGANKSGELTDLTTKLNVTLTNAPDVPELGLVIGAAATVLGGVGYLTIRSRETSGRKT